MPYNNSCANTVLQISACSRVSTWSGARHLAGALVADERQRVRIHAERDKAVQDAGYWQLERQAGAAPRRLRAYESRTIIYKTQLLIWLFPLLLLGAKPFCTRCWRVLAHAPG